MQGRKDQDEDSSLTGKGFLLINFPGVSRLAVNMVPDRSLQALLPVPSFRGVILSVKLPFPGIQVPLFVNVPVSLFLIPSFLCRVLNVL